ncbi:hypothetical protein HDE_03997 [Halotydeus destructor]|nr:hypothetical protein HDE_03997 [Halotydeus destructor]
MNIWLNVFGLQLFDVAKGRTFLGHIGFSATIVCYLYRLVNMVIALQTDISYQKIQKLVFFLTFIPAVLTIRLKKRQLRALFADMTGILTNQSTAKLKKRLTYYLVFIVIHFIADTVRMSVLVLGAERSEWTFFVVVGDVLSAAYQSLVVTAMFTTMTMLYHACVTMIAFAQQDFIRYHITLEADMDYLQGRLRNLRVIKSKLDDIISIIPLPYIGTLFVDVLSVATLMAKHATWKTLGFYSLYYAAIDCFAFLSMLVHIDCAEKSTKTSVFQLTDKYKDIRIDSKMNALLDSIEQSFTLNFTAWSLFTLNRSVLLTFVSTCVSFTVLAVQLQL